jgi:hypothetical protein
MKKLLYIIIGVVTLLTSCDNIDEADRLIYVKPADVSRCVLIEDFTGQKCVNCPKATDVIEALQKQYGADTIIAVGIHSGPLGFYTKGDKLGLSTKTGDEYYSAWNIEQQPMGLVDRVGGALLHTNWATAVHDELQKKAPVSIAIDNTYNESDSTVSIKVNTLGISGSTTGKLQLWAIEDSIVAMQMMPDGSLNSTYIHNHVFRTAINGTWGDDFSTNEGETKTASYSLKIDKLWKPEHVSIIAFVYNDSGVQQVTKKKIK